MTGVPVYKLECRDERAALRLADLLKHRSYFGITTDDSVLCMPWGGSIERLFEVGGWARECGLAGDIEVSEFYMQGAREIEKRDAA